MLFLSIGSISTEAAFSAVITANNSFEWDIDIALPFDSSGAPNLLYDNCSLGKSFLISFSLAIISFLRLFFIEFVNDDFQSYIMYQLIQLLIETYLFFFEIKNLTLVEQYSLK